MLEVKMAGKPMSEMVIELRKEDLQTEQAHA